MVTTEVAHCHCHCQPLPLPTTVTATATATPISGVIRTRADLSSTKKTTATAIFVHPEPRLIPFLPKKKKKKKPPGPSKNWVTLALSGVIRTALSRRIQPHHCHNLHLNTHRSSLSQVPTSHRNLITFSPIWQRSKQLISPVSKRHDHIHIWYHSNRADETNPATPLPQPYHCHPPPWPFISPQKPQPPPKK
jgi:hypothetical protein